MLAILFSAASVASGDCAAGAASATCAGYCHGGGGLACATCGANGASVAGTTSAS